MMNDIIGTMVNHWNMCYYEELLELYISIIEKHHLLIIYPPIPIITFMVNHWNMYIYIYVWLVVGPPL